MAEGYPTLRPMGRFRDDEIGFEADRSPTHALLPWIDIHGHHHTLTWTDHEEFELSGCFAVVMSGGLANESPYRPMTAGDVRAGLDTAIRASHAIARSHFLEAYATVGVHTSVGPIEGLDELLDLVPRYAQLDEVVAISETGISMVQEHETVPLEAQRRIVREQLDIARATGLPAVLHTPTVTKGDAEYAERSTEAHDQGDLVLDPTGAKQSAVEIDVELANEVGLPEDRLVFTHADRSMAAWVLEHTDCHVSFTVGNATRDVGAEDIASTIDAYGSDRVMIDSDSAGHKGLEPFAVKRTMLDLLKREIEPAAVRTVAYENPRDVLGLDHLPE